MCCGGFILVSLPITWVFNLLFYLNSQTRKTSGELDVVFGVDQKQILDLHQQLHLTKAEHCDQVSAVLVFQGVTCS